MNLKKSIYNHLINIPKKSIKNKVIIFESDDWGSVRIPSKDVQKKLEQSGINISSCPYSKYDCLETKEDIEILVNTLGVTKNSNCGTAIFTMNYLTANPDFNKIRDDNFQNYYYEPINITYEKSNSPDTLKTIQNAISDGIICPQYHGREHLNSFVWLDLLKVTKSIRNAFDLNVFALSFANANDIKIPYLATFLKYGEDYINNNINVFNSGLDIFNDIFKFYPKTFIPPVYFLDYYLEKNSILKGIMGIQGLAIQRNYYNRKGNNSSKYRFLRNKNDFGQINLIRNCFFEPSLSNNIDWIDSVLFEIKTAFFWNKPAIISSHRLNYIGSLDEHNRKKNIDALKTLIKKIIKHWPDVRFMSSEQYVNFVKKQKNV